MTITTRLAVALAVAAGSVVLGADVLTDLGIPASEGTQLAVRAVAAGAIPWGAAAQKFKAGDPPQRVGLVKNTIAWARTVTASSAFAEAYSKARDQMKPQPPADAVSFDEQMKQQLAEIDKTETQMRKQFAGQPDTLTQMLATLDLSRQQMQAMAKNPDMRKAFEAQSAESKKAYEARLAQFDAEHPADPRAAVAIQLRRFLDVCGDLDFGAQLKRSGSRMIFVDPRYEARSAEWKTCFRAGREPVEAAKTLASAWLKEIGG